MATLLQKTQTLISANLHALVDKALQSNSVAVLDEYIRQSENNLSQLKEAIITVKGQVKTLKRKADEFAAKAEQLDADVDRLLQSGKEDLAAATLSKYNSTVEMAEQYREQHEIQQREAEKLNQSRLKLEAKLETIKQEREHTIALLDLAKSKEVVVKTMRSLDDLEGVGDADISRLTGAIRERLDRADAAMEVEAEDLGEQLDEVLGKEQLDSQLADRKRRLGLS